MMEKTSLYFKEGSSDKEYHVTLDEGTVMVQYGRRGSALTTLSKCNDCPPNKARKVYENLIKEKIAKGYRPGENGDNYQAPVNPEQTSFAPQLLNEVDEETAMRLIQDDNWLLQEKEDGRNVGIICDENGIIGANKKGLKISLPQKVADVFLTLFDVTLSGELIGETFKVWDIQAKQMTGRETYLDRYRLLVSTMTQIGRPLNVTRTAINTVEKLALYELIKREGGEGIVLKRKDSLFTPGRPASGGDMLKYKFTSTCSVICGKQNMGKRSVELFLIDFNGKVINVGNATIYPNQDIPEDGSILEVKYLYAYPGGSLYQPVYLHQRDDVHHGECTISQLKYKKESEE